MKTESLSPLERTLKIDMQSHLLRYNVETSENEEGQMVYKADEVKVFDPSNRAEVISVIIRDKYSADQVEAIMANYMAGDDQGQMLEYQRWRKLAKAAADGSWLKSDLEGVLVDEVIDRIKSIEQDTEAITDVLNDKGLLS